MIQSEWDAFEQSYSSARKRRAFRKNQSRIVQAAIRPFRQFIGFNYTTPPQRRHSYRRLSWVTS